MSVDALAAPLLRVALFQGLTPNQLMEIARRAERIVFKAGDVMVAEGAPGHAAYLVVSGAAELIDLDTAKTKPVAVVTGSLIGEMAMFIEHEYAATIRAVGAVRALKISRAQMHLLMERDPSLAEHFTQLITERLFQVADELRRVDDIIAGSTKLLGAAGDDGDAFLPGFIAADRALPAPVMH
jgi:CRP-like cAMP-binding protein